MVQNKHKKVKIYIYIYEYARKKKTCGLYGIKTLDLIPQGKQRAAPELPIFRLYFTWTYSSGLTCIYYCWCILRIRTAVVPVSEPGKKKVWGKSCFLMKTTLILTPDGFFELVVGMDIWDVGTIVLQKKENEDGTPRRDTSRARPRARPPQRRERRERWGKARKQRTEKWALSRKSRKWLQRPRLKKQLWSSDTTHHMSWYKSCEYVYWFTTPYNVLRAPCTLRTGLYIYIYIYLGGTFQR